eukprot:scaffold82393_cov63-Phaeocystis_antarctica.AAC.7
MDRALYVDRGEVWPKECVWVLCEQPCPGGGCQSAKVLGDSLLVTARLPASILVLVAVGQALKLKQPASLAARPSLMSEDSPRLHAVCTTKPPRYGATARPKAQGASPRMSHGACERARLSRL